MNKQILYCCLALSPHFSLFSPPTDTITAAQHITLDSKGQPIHVAVNIKPKIHVQPEIKPQNIFQPDNQINMSQDSAAIAQSKSTATNTTMNQIRVHIMQLMEKLKTISPQHMKTSLLQWARSHRRKIIMPTIASAYLIISALLIRGNRFLCRSNTWAQWKKDMPLDELLLIPNNQLGTELMHHIQQRYVNTKNPTDHLTPLVQFIQATESEMKLLNQYLVLANIVQRSHLTLFFPTNRQKIACAQTQKQRLLFVKHTFISWTATDNLYNFNHHEHKLS